MGDTRDFFSSRLDVPVFPISIPKVGRGRKREIAWQIVRGMYPASLEGMALILKRNGDNGSCLAFVVDSADRSGPLRSSTLYAARLARRLGLRDGVMIVFDATYVERIAIASGSVASSVARSRESDPARCLSGGVPPGNGTVILRDRKDGAARSIAERAGTACHLFPDGLLSAVTESAYSLRPLASRFVRVVGALAIVLTLLLASFAASRVADRAAASAREAEARRLALERDTAESARRETLRAEYERLLAEYNLRVLSRPYDPFSVLSLVHDAIGREPKIRKIEMKGNDIAVSLSTSYSVPVVASLERNPYIYDLAFRDYGADRSKPGLFITASFRYPKLREARGDLPDKIADVRERLNGLADRAGKRPSLVSGYFDHLVTRAGIAGCRLERVESMGEGAHVALSFVAKGSVRSVLRFLKDTCTGVARLSYRTASVEYVQESSIIVLTGVILTDIKTEAGERETASELMQRSARKEPVDLTGLFCRAAPAATSDGTPKGPRRGTPVERATWLRYMGYVRGNDEEWLYLRNERDGSTLRFGRSLAGSDGVVRSNDGEVEVLLGGTRYAIVR